MRNTPRTAHFSRTMARYRFFQRKEWPVIPTLSLAKKEQQKSFWEHGRPQWLHALRPRHKHLADCRSVSYRLAACRSWGSIYFQKRDGHGHSFPLRKYPSDNLSAVREMCVLTMFTCAVCVITSYFPSDNLPNF